MIAKRITSRSLLAFGVAVLAAFTVASADAATMTSSATAPTIDGQDIASYGTPTGQDKWWPSTATAYGTPGMTVGQTFTTGSQGVQLSAITFQIRDATQPTKDYTVRVGLISGPTGTTFDTIASESITQGFATAGDDYWTWTLDTPVFLFPDTVYGVDVGLHRSSSVWETGIPYVYYTADVYPDGTRFRSGTAGDGIGDNSVAQMSGDRVFHLDLTAVQPPLLTLHVNTTSGATTLLGYATQDTVINYYQVTSAGNSLDAVGWRSLADQDYEGSGPPDGSGNGWEEAGGAGSHALAEAFLLGNSTIGTSASIGLGAGYDESVDAQDLVFTYQTDTGQIIDGLVEYFSPLAGDVDNDGDIDNADIGKAAGSFTGAGLSTAKTWADGDVDGDGDVDNADIGLIAGAFTGSHAGRTMVPEPATLSLMALGALALLRRRRA